MKDQVGAVVRKVIPYSIRQTIVRYTRWPPVGRVSFHDLRRLKPISPAWGGDRGLPIDRYYIEQFLASSCNDIRGHVLEIGNDTYTLKFGSERVTKVDVLHAIEGNRKATIIADLADAPHIPDNTFDCIICTQTLQLIPNLKNAIKTLHRILRPGGILLATAPAISRLEINKQNAWLDHWRFTSHGFNWLFTIDFHPADVTILAYGNVLTIVAFLHGLAAQELEPVELNYTDPAYEMLVAVRAVKQA